MSDKKSDEKPSEDPPVVGVQPPVEKAPASKTGKGVQPLTEDDIPEGGR